MKPFTFPQIAGIIVIGLLAGLGWVKVIEIACDAGQAVLKAIERGAAQAVKSESPSEPEGGK